MTFDGRVKVNDKIRRRRRSRWAWEPDDHSIPLAARNVALGRPTEQSATLWNYNSELAADDGKGAFRYDVRKFFTYFDPLSLVRIWI